MSAAGTVSGPGPLDLSPAPGAAPAGTRVLRHALTEFRLLVRNGEQLLLALVIPLAILVLAALTRGRFVPLADAAPSVLALAVWSSAFTSTAIATGFERRYGVLERLAATPLGRGGLLLGKALAVALVLLAQLVVLAVVALALGWRPAYTGASVLASLALLVLAAVAFVALALLLAGRLRAEITLAVANLVYVVLLVAGGLVLPVARYPRVLQPVVEALPTAALGEGLRAGAAGTVLGWPFAVLAVWLVVAVLVARRGFRWTS
ncbi:ABC transporter permease [Microlunatus flavus]|uniref:ABC-2 type transport system permease protein n=1 Tax=Microlunatus flavus TaxID=1036181 RepID=A0A1H9H313_9ACTN|nr:ABC transporter permease [Microlunatus flavus]SEQ56689.1 ABC-2 type transport system permease protein [Microlunatus flavus]